MARCIQSGVSRKCDHRPKLWEPPADALVPPQQVVATELLCRYCLNKHEHVRSPPLCRSLPFVPLIVLRLCSLHLTLRNTSHMCALESFLNDSIATSLLIAPRCSFGKVFPPEPFPTAPSEATKQGISRTKGMEAVQQCGAKQNIIWTSALPKQRRALQAQRHSV